VKSPPKNRLKILRVFGAPTVIGRNHHRSLCRIWLICSLWPPGAQGGFYGSRALPLAESPRVLSSWKLSAAARKLSRRQLWCQKPSSSFSQSSHNTGLWPFFLKIRQDLFSQFWKKKAKVRYCEKIVRRNQTVFGAHYCPLCRCAPLFTKGRRRPASAWQA